MIRPDLLSPTPFSGFSFSAFKVLAFSANSFGSTAKIHNTRPAPLNPPVKLLIANDRPVKNAKVLILGWTFKEDVPDIRNTRVIDIYRELQSYGADVSCYDPQADIAEVEHEYGIELLKAVPQAGPFDAIILAVKHRALVAAYTWETIQSLGNGRSPVLIDVKCFLGRDVLHAEKFISWQL